MQSEEKYEKINKSLQFGASIMLAINQASTAIRLDIDETVVNAMLGIIDKEKIFSLFARVVATFKQSNSK